MPRSTRRPYLFEGSGQRAARPMINTVPARLELGANFRISVASSRPIQRVTLLRTGSVTHSTDFEQRFLELPFTQAPGDANVDITLNESPNILPPGHYMLFAIDSAGVPSVAKIMKLGAGWTQVAAQNQAFTLGSSTVVRYGAGENWIEKTTTGTLTCSSESFGSDPAPGVPKACYVLTPRASGVTSGPVPPPPAPPAPRRHAGRGGRLLHRRQLDGGPLRCRFALDREDRQRHGALHQRLLRRRSRAGRGEVLHGGRCPARAAATATRAAAGARTGRRAGAGGRHLQRRGTDARALRRRHALGREDGHGHGGLHQCVLRHRSGTERGEGLLRERGADARATRATAPGTTSAGARPALTPRRRHHRPPRPRRRRRARWRRKTAPSRSAR